MTSRPCFESKHIEAMFFQVHSFCIFCECVQSGSVASDQNKLADEGLCHLLSSGCIQIRADYLCTWPSPNTAPFTASAYQLNPSTWPIGPLLVFKLIFNEHSLLVDSMEDFQTKDFHQLWKWRHHEMALGSSECSDSCIPSLAYDVPLWIKHQNSLKTREAKWWKPKQFEKNWQYLW